MAKKNEETKTAEQLELEAAKANAELIDTEQLLEQDRKNKEALAAAEAAKGEKPEDKKEESIAVVNTTDTPLFDEDGNLIAPAATAAITSSEIKSSLAKRLKEQFEDLELDDNDDDDKALSIIKKLKEERDLSVFALQAEAEFENSDIVKHINSFIAKSDEEKYREYLIAQKLGENYDKSYAEKFADKEIAKAKERAEDGEDDIISIEGRRLNNLAKNDLNNYKIAFLRLGISASSSDVS
jgi:uncharacterized secreted protein with C-terminal beta-propeller domain